MNEPITIDLSAGLLTLGLNRPDKLNALTNAMYSSLAEALFDAAENPDVKVVLLTGGEHVFTSGNDLEDFLRVPPTDLDSPAFRFMASVIELEKPLIAAVCGAAIGIGMTLLLHCDYVAVSRNAKLRMPFVSLGLCPEFGATLLLPRLLGRARAAGLLLLGETLDGTKAVAWGFANEVLEDGAQCLAVARQQASRFLALPPDALRQTKQLLKRADFQQLQDTLRQENLLFIARLGSAEAQQALGTALSRSTSKLGKAASGERPNPQQ